MENSSNFWNELNFSLMYHSMEMNALESLKDTKMIKLDILSGLLAEILIKFIFRENYKINPLNIFLILASRSIVDVLYYNLISKTDAFGGSLLEIGLSIIVFALLYKIINPGRNLGLIHGLIHLIVLFAVARITNWG